MIKMRGLYSQNTNKANKKGKIRQETLITHEYTIIEKTVNVNGKGDRIEFICVYIVTVLLILKYYI